MLPKNDSEYVKNAAIATLIFFGWAFAFFFVVYAILSERIFLTFVLVCLLSLALFLKDLSKKAYEAIKAIFKKILGSILPK